MPIILACKLVTTGNYFGVNDPTSLPLILYVFVLQSELVEKKCHKTAAAVSVC